MIVDELGLAVLRVRSAIAQVGEPASARQRREAIVVALMLSPLVLGLLVTSLPPPGKKP